MRRKVDNSEIHEIKRYYEVPSEKVQEWSNTIEELAKQCDQYKTERDTLREKNEKLESANRELAAAREIMTSNTGNITNNNKRLEGEVRYWKQLYITLTDHIRLKASANPGVDRYIALVNFIDRLEKGEN